MVPNETRRLVLQALCEELEGAMHRDSIPHKVFICEQDVSRIVTQNDAIFSFEAWTENEKAVLKKQCCQTLAALVLAGAFTAVERLRGFFFPHDSDYPEPKIKDNDLWVSNDHDLTPLPYEIRKLFLQSQYRVKPYIISEQDPNKTIELDSNVRLPITHEKLNIGMGGYGKVSEIRIPPRYFKTRKGAVYPSEQVFALKSIQIKEDFFQEVRNLGILKESLTSHDRIIQHHATFIQGNTYHILLPRAKFGDLALFLNEGQAVFGDGQSYQFDEQFPNYRRGNSAGDLLNQTASIADALKWLHHDLRIEGEADLYLLHMDLKPGNILIMEDDTSSRKSTVGKWVLTDFGISVCKETDRDSASQRTAVITIRDAYERLDAPSTKESQTRPRRCEGKYQAPEVRFSVERTVGRKSDVWSLACITAEVVAFSLEGKQALEEFENRRLEDNHRDDYFYLESRDPAQEPSLRPGVKSFLSGLIEKHNECGAWLDHVITVILETLKIRATGRPSAGQFRSLLTHVSQVIVHGRCATQNCPVTRIHESPRATHPQSAFFSSESSDNASLDDKNEGSLVRLPSSPASSLSRSSTELTRRLTALSYQPRPKSQGSSPNRLGPGSYKNIAICPSNTYVALLSDSGAQITRLDAETGELDLEYPIALPATTDWEEIELAGAFLGLKGRTKNRNSSYNKVTFFDIRRSELALPVSDDDALSSLNSLAVSSNGMSALVSLGCIHIFDLRENPIKRIANGKFLPSPGGNFFDCAKFTASGDSLFAWSYRRRGEDALYCWKFDEERKFQNNIFRISSDYDGGPHVSLMPANDLGLPKCTHCLVTRKDTHHAVDRFLLTCIRNGDGGNFQQTEIKCTSVKLAALHQNRFLVTLERQNWKKNQLCCSSVDFCDPPRIGATEVLKSDLSSEFSHKMMLAQIQERYTIILIARNGTTLSIPFNCP
ncbi:hypothetical protein MMC10_006001 [Thelotrema lepadinum]|nr:hypothetical protein [Thelotrema lepadinum]